MASPYLIQNELTDSIGNYQVIINKLKTLRDILRNDKICYSVWTFEHTEHNVRIVFNHDIPMEFILKLSENDIKFKVDKLTIDNQINKQVVII